MKKLIIGLVAALGLVAGVHASEGGIAWDKAPKHALNILTDLK